MDIFDTIGQCFCIGVPEEGVTPQYLDIIREIRPGAFILFSRNTKGGREFVKDLTNLLSDALVVTGSPPPIICVDQEGGKVSRLRPPHWPYLPSFEELSNASEPEKAVSDCAVLCASMLKECGINMNLAPCLDLRSKGKCNPVLSERTFSQDPYKAARLGEIYISTLQKMGILSVAKHFPGIGGLDIDPHTDIAMIRRSIQETEEALFPFISAINSNCAGIMTSHVIEPNLDPSEIATFSQRIVKIMIKEQYGFEGIALSDDLFMGAIRRHIPPFMAGKKALMAGHDMLLYCHRPDITLRAVRKIKKEAQTDAMLLKRLIDGSQSVLKVKNRILLS